MNSLLLVLKNKYLPFLFAIPLFFCVHRYNGIVMDAILYVTQYVNSIDPLRFSGDPSFEYGNQGSLGFFSPIFGFFLEKFGVSAGSFVFTLLTQFAWIVMYVFLIKNLLRLAWCRLWVLPVTIFMICVFASRMPFSHTFWFHYVSSYACSRALSIPLAMGGLALIFIKKKFLSLLLILVGVVIHPISAGWCIPFWMFYFFPKTRVLVLFFSLVFPFSFLLHLGVLDTYPVDWLSRPLDLCPRYDMFCLNFFLLVFFGMLAKTVANQDVQKISFSMIFLIIISFYWNIWAGYGEHVFLYQVQPWRALWLPTVVAVPLGTCLFVKSFRNAFRKKSLVTFDLGVILLVISFFVQIHPLLVSLAIIILCIIKRKKVSLMQIALLFGALLLGAYLLQQYITWSLQGFPSIFDWSILELCQIRDAYLMYQFIFSLGFIIFFLKNKCFFSALIMVASVFFAHYMLLPVLSFYFYFFPKEKRMRFWCGMLVIVLLVLFDGMIDVESRNHFLVHRMPQSFFVACPVVIASYISIYSSKRMAYKGVSVWIIFSCVLAVACYGINSANWREKEGQLDQYLHESIFPKVMDRGRILFFVSGAFVDNPRLQFMTGSYFNESIEAGTLFYKDHYRSTLERSHLLFWGERKPESKKIFRNSEILSKFTNADSLISRVSFLCEINEIHHLISDKDSLPFVKEDSTVINGLQKVYLYGCDGK